MGTQKEYDTKGKKKYIDSKLIFVDFLLFFCA